MKRRKLVMLAVLCVAAPALWGTGVAVSEPPDTVIFQSRASERLPTVLTGKQALVIAALRELKLEVKPDKFAGQERYEATEETLEFLKDKVVIVDHHGRAKVAKKATEEGVFSETSVHTTVTVGELQPRSYNRKP